jgi:alpha-ketoglutarate-dependent taurine dioxygenase
VGLTGDPYACAVNDTMFELDPLDATFGGIVRGVELRALDDEAWQALHDVWVDRALLIFPGQFLTRAEQDEFAGRFGDLEFPASPIANIDADGTVHSEPDDDRVKGLRGNEGWHHDSTYMPLQAKGAVFTAEIVPREGAATGWADMRAAYEALDEATQRLVQGLSAYHSLTYSQGRAGYLPSKRSAKGGYEGYGYHDGETPLRPLVKVHPETGRPNLVIGPDESERFLDDLADAACQPPRIYHHHWTVGDAVVWDNRRLMHQGTPFDMTQPRRMWHTRIAGDRPYELATNYA